MWLGERPSQHGHSFDLDVNNQTNQQITASILPYLSTSDDQNIFKYATDFSSSEVSSRFKAMVSSLIARWWVRSHTEGQPLGKAFIRLLVADACFWLGPP